MYPKLDVEIRPGVGLGQFELGMSLWTVLDMLRNDPHSFPQVDVKYDPDSPISPVILHLRPHLDLLFSGKHQRLHTICLKKLQDPHPPVTLRYKNMILSSPKDILRRVGVSRAFGPTYAGDDLRYPGVWFSFEEDGRADTLRPSSPQHEEKTQEVKRVIVSQKNASEDADDVLSEVRVCDAMHGDIESAIVKAHDGVTLKFYPSSMPSVNVRIGITTAQDLTCDLGPPIRVHYREDNRMNIHSKSKEEDPDIDTGYFYNYFQHGIDFLIGGTTHVVKKIIIHSNMPGTPLFQRYKRCPWAIQGRPEDDEDDTPPRKWFYDRFEDIRHFLSPGETPPTMRLDRTDEEDGLTLPNSSTELLGFDGVVLEVAESAHVVAVMLF
ncbi:UPF0183-domain-containing protein [Phanerochaete sordida]|uniref:UPF0183-domain-containing protein n=1 Tax=Phanerochaete sordida TaxID=48140 RepID=A0A9P3L807_9APHY|nr:UPF0183-domain-containing protein [Phanerochaete sordida]